MTNQLPIVAGICANYNFSKYIQDAVLSFTNNDYPAKVLAIIDDCSTDDSVNKILELGQFNEIDTVFGRDTEIATKYHGLVNNVNVFVLKLATNGGPSRARNIGLGAAFTMGANLILVCDGDDMPYPSKITKLIQPILMNPEEVVITYGDYLIVNENGLVRYECKLPYDYNVLFSGNSIIHSGALISSIALKPLMPTPYSEAVRVCEDLGLWISILKNRSFIAVHCAEPLTLVRSHGDDSSNSVSKEVWQRDYSRVMGFR